MTKDKATDDSRVKELFAQLMSKEGAAPIKWIIQVTPALEQK